MAKTQKKELVTSPKGMHDVYGEDAQYIDRVFKEGSAVKGSFLFIRYSKNNLLFPRFVLIVPAKSFNKATARNRIKRVLSEIVRKYIKNISSPHDIVIMIKKGDQKDISRELTELLLKTNLWQK